MTKYVYVSNPCPCSPITQISGYPLSCEVRNHRHNPLSGFKNIRRCLHLLGVLRDDEIEAFSSMSDIENSPHFTLLTMDAPNTGSIVEQLKHKKEMEAGLWCSEHRNERDNFKRIVKQIISLRPQATPAVPVLSDASCHPQQIQAATGKGNRPTSLAEIKAEEAEISWADEPADTRTMDIGPNAKTALKEAIVEAMSVYHDPKHETDAERWDRLSRTKFDGTGWAELAKMDLEAKGISPTKSKTREKADEIRKAVERLRKKQ